MKKLTSIILFICIFCPSSAQAQRMSMLDWLDPTLYAKGEVSASKIQPNDNIRDNVDDSFAFFGAGIGIKMRERISLEAFFQKSDSIKFTADGVSGSYESSMDFTAWGVEAAFYIPVQRYVDLFASVGGGYYTFDLDEDDDISSLGISVDINKTDESFFGLRVGGGAEFKIHPSVSVTAAGRYVYFDKDKSDMGIKNMTEFAFGVRIYF